MLGVDGDLAPSLVIPVTTEWTVNPGFFALLSNIELHATLRRRFFERRFRLQPVDVDVLWHDGLVNRVRSCYRCVSMGATRTKNARLTERDHDILRLLDRTPVSSALILKASGCFAESFEDLRRVRERMQALADGGWVRSSPMATTSRRAANWHRLTPDGYRLLYGADAVLPHKTVFMPMPPSRQEHTLWLAEVIVQTMVAAEQSLLTINDYRGENAVVLSMGSETLKPDGSMQLQTADGRPFNFFIELDNGTEPVRSPQHRESIERKIRFYERLQDAVLAKWKGSDRSKPPPRYRVLFFMRSTERMKHVLSTAGQLAGNPDRKLCLGVSVAEYLSDPNPLRLPIALEHDGNWQPIVNECYEAQFHRKPASLTGVEQSRTVLTGFE